MDIVRSVTMQMFAMVAAGEIVGIAMGLWAAHYIESLFYQVHATDPSMLLLPLLTFLIVAVLAALPPVLRAVRINLVSALRGE
jgi:ABC-type antimicrobial peptide transport system permease subunit